MVFVCVCLKIAAPKCPEHVLSWETEGLIIHREFLCDKPPRVTSKGDLVQDLRVLVKLYPVYLSLKQSNLKERHVPMCLSDEKSAEVRRLIKKMKSCPSFSGDVGGKQKHCKYVLHEQYSNYLKIPWWLKTQEHKVVGGEIQF